VQRPVEKSAVKPPPLPKPAKPAESAETLPATTSSPESQPELIKKSPTPYGDMATKKRRKKKRDDD